MCMQELPNQKYFRIDSVISLCVLVNLGRRNAPNLFLSDMDVLFFRSLPDFLRVRVEIATEIAVIRIAAISNR